MIAELSQNWLLYAAIPVIGALIGYVTKRVAIEMMFRPAHRTFGWQGVVPKHRGRIAGIAAELLTTRLIDPREVLDRIDVDRINAEIEQPLLNAVDAIARDVITEHHPTMWEALPPLAQDMVIKQVQAATPRVVAQTLTELRENIDAVVDVKQFALAQLTKDDDRLVRIVRELARPELTFIARSGIWFGFVIGIAQAVVWALTKEPLVMPIFGAAIGLLTDWLAITLVFRPREPVSILGWPVRGSFHRRRADVAHRYARLIADEVLTVPNMLTAVLSGPRADRMLSLIEDVVADAVNEQTRAFRPLLAATGRNVAVGQLHRAAALKAMPMIPDTARSANGYLTSAMDVAGMIERRMLALPADEYESLLRPAFKQEEPKLIVVGGIIGAIIGELQLLLLFL
ncbi:DUF445 domain-containing protein [Haloechinothrix salitolerans]|uniref:DUF445 domain-containing protein n=1 Tax=Haloechinothrix salitolerans TaxID=926830 RepID=A0ABW2BTM2_9PSEU